MFSNCRQLCLDALVEEGDENSDWRLSFGEFKRLLSESFEPSVKGEVRLAVRLVHSHWSRSYITALSLVESFTSDAFASNLMP